MFPARLLSDIETCVCFWKDTVKTHMCLFFLMKSFRKRGDVFLCFLTNTQERGNSANLDVFPTDTMNACLFPVQNKGYACLFPSLERENMETRMCKFCVSLCFLKRPKIQNHIDAST